MYQRLWTSLLLITYINMVLTSCLIVCLCWREVVCLFTGKCFCPSPVGCLALPYSTLLPHPCPTHPICDRSLTVVRTSDRWPGCWHHGNPRTCRTRINYFKWKWICEEAYLPFTCWKIFVKISQICRLSVVVMIWAMLLTAWSSDTSHWLHD